MLHACTAVSSSRLIRIITGALAFFPAQIKAYRLMDNRSHQETDWDFELLTTELLELRDLDRHASRQRLESGSEEECISDTSQSPAGWPRGIASSARPGTQCGRKRSRRLRYPGNSG